MSAASPGSYGHPGRYRWYVFCVLAFGYFLVYFHRLAPAVVAVDLMRDLSARGTLMGVLGAAYFYPYALMQLPAGLLADSWGARRTITLFMLLAAAGSVLFALAPSAWLAIVGRALVGFGVAMLFVPALKALTEWFTPREFVIMTGVLFAVGGVGSLASAGPLALASDRFGWRTVFVGIALLSLLLALLVWVIVRDRPEQLFSGVGRGTPTAVKSYSLARGVRTVLGCRHFWPLAVWFFAQCAIFFSFGGLWGGPYLQHVYGFDRAMSGRLLSLLSVGMILGSPLLTWLSSQVFRARKPVILLCSLASVLLVALLVLKTPSLPGWGLGGICLGLGMFSSAVVVIGFAATKELFPVAIAGTAIGLVNLFPFAGGALMQPVLGAILERGRLPSGVFSVQAYHDAFAVLLACACVALFSALWIREPRPSAASTGEGAPLPLE